MSKPNNQGATTVKVSTNTGAAKDESFAGFNEDNVRVSLDLLANDPGSAKLWSLDQNALNAPQNSQQPQNLNAFTLASGATIALNADGTVNYDGSAALQWLAAGDVYRDSFIYTIRMANGALSTATATVEVLGVNDVAIIGGDATGSVQEDGETLTGGTLTVFDIDHDESGFAATGALAGTYGDFSFDLGTGAWTYTLRNADANVQALGSGETVQDTLLVSTIDGTSSEIVVTIAGADEPVVEEPVDTNPADMWVVNKNNVTKTGGGLQVGFENGVAKVTGFDSNDTLHTTSLNQDDPFIQLVDTDNDGNVDSTLLNFSYAQGQGTYHVDVVLVGYTEFSTSQLFHG